MLDGVGFPGPVRFSLGAYARDTFVDALADPNLRWRILERDLSTLEEALKVASRLEALSGSVNDMSYDECWDESGRRKNGQSRTDAYVNGGSELKQLVGELRDERRHMREQMNSFCHRQRKEVETLRQSMRDEVAGVADRLAESLSKPLLSSTNRVGANRAGNVHVQNIGSTTTTEVSRTSASPSATPQRRPEDRCHRCRQPGHWKQDCPQKPAQSRGVVTPNSGMKAYLDVTVAGHHSICLLDSGCELSMLPRRYVPNADLNPTSMEMYAANGTNIPVIGSVRISFTAGGIPVSTTCLVSEAVDEPMLGLDCEPRTNALGIKPRAFCTLVRLAYP